MKAAACLCVAVLLAACGAGDDGNPRDRTGSSGPPTWRIVADGAGSAAFLSRPGAAPDVVVWCRGDGRATVRAHVFERPADQPDLSLTTSGGIIVLEGVRRQGALRDGGRALVEGSVSMRDPKVQAVLAAASSTALTSRGVEWSAGNADPEGVMAGFAARCSEAPP